MKLKSSVCFSTFRFRSSGNGSVERMSRSTQRCGGQEKWDFSIISHPDEENGTRAVPGGDFLEETGGIAMDGKQRRGLARSLEGGADARS